MKPFHLDTVLKYRKRLEDLAIDRLFEAKRQQKIVRHKLDENNKHLANLIEKSEQLQNETISILDLINYENRILFVKNTIRAVQKKLDEKTEHTKREQLNLIDKSKNRQILASLKEKQNKLWKDYLDKREVAMLDEIAILRHGAEK